MKKREIDAMLRRIAEGDNEAFERLYTETKRGVYAFLYTYFNNRFDCEDVMQTVYLNIKSNISGYRFGTNASAWILQIAKNAALNELRARATREKYAPKESDSWYDNTERAAVRDMITSAMKRVLDEDEQRIVVLHIVWGYKHKEIAADTGAPIGTITSKYKRAVEKLKKALKEEMQ